MLSKMEPVPKLTGGFLIKGVVAGTTGRCFEKEINLCYGGIYV